MAIGSGLLGTLLSAFFKSVWTAINTWVRARKAAWQKARADALAAREASRDRAEATEDEMDAAAKAIEDEAPAESDMDKITKIKEFLEMNHANNE